MSRSRSELERQTELALRAVKEDGRADHRDRVAGIASLIEAHHRRRQEPRCSHRATAYLKEYGAGVDFATCWPSPPRLSGCSKAIVLRADPSSSTEQTYAAARDQYLPALRRLVQDYFCPHRRRRHGITDDDGPSQRIGEKTTVDVGGVPPSIRRSRDNKRSRRRHTEVIPGAGFARSESITRVFRWAIELDAPAGARP